MRTHVPILLALSAAVAPAAARAQAALARLSRSGREVVVAGSGHHVHTERPELVADAIREVVTAAAARR